MTEKIEKTGARLHILSNSHIDAAWLWPRSETIDVCKLTFERVLKLMRKRPELTYAQSSAQFYKWMEEHHPEIFEEIRKRVKEGKWEIVGGSWVEFDANIPSGESIVRQFLYGKKYFEEKFGVYTEVAWFPDCFGFPSTLPMLLKSCGMKYFLTQKLRWNDTTIFPYNVFWWEYADGSRVLAHQTVGSYNETLGATNPGLVKTLLAKIFIKMLFKTSPSEALSLLLLVPGGLRDLARQAKLLELRHGIKDLLVLIGYGDHGGGPTEEMMKMADYIRQQKVFEEVKFTTAKEYFKLLEELSRSVEYPVVRDELYLQYHRGVYTTIARIKWLNRKSEVKLEVAEKLAAINYLLGEEYPSSKLEEAWRLLLFNQFHDIICGSSIPEVYEEAEQDFKKLFEIVDEIIESSLSAIASRVKVEGEGTPLIVFNPLSWHRTGVIEVPLDEYGLKWPICAVDSSGEKLPCQLAGKKALILVKDVPPIGYKTILLREEEAEVKTDLFAREEGENIILENKFVKVVIDKKTGLLKSLYSKTLNREFLREESNVIQVFEDKPVRGRATIATEAPFDAVMFDAWEIYIYQQPGGVKFVELREPVEVKLVETGPVRARVEVKYVYTQEGRPDSTFTIYIDLYAGIPLVEFTCDVDWHAAHRLAKVAFNFTLDSEEAVFEAPYGFVVRRDPLSLKATLEERAKWEVPGQKWVDYTDSAKTVGVALLNDCKYGFDFTKGVVRMTLLRSARYPARWGEPTPVEKLPFTDQGKHTIKYALYVHDGDWRTGKVPHKAYEFNYPMLIKLVKEREGEFPPEKSFFTVKPDTAILTVIKKAEKGDALVLRFYDTSGSDTTVEIECFKPVKKAVEVNCVEETVGEVEFEEKKVRVKCGKYQVKSALVEFE